MDETTFRILDALSRQLGSDISINELTKEIEGLHGSAYYANIYRALQNLVETGIIALAKAGKSYFISLNFGNYLAIDFLAEMELRRKYELLRRNPEMQMLLAEIGSQCSDFPIKSISLINPERNIRLNRTELLIMLQKRSEEEMDALQETMQALYRRHNMRIDYLAIRREEFEDLLKSEERNPLKEMLSDKIAFFNPQAFWMAIAEAFEKGIRVRIERQETNPAKISEQDMTFNLARFGYKEIGAEIKQGERICIEYIITSILLKGDARRIEAIPILLAKNQANYSLLVFLSRKYALSDRLLGLLKALNSIRPKKEVQEAIRSLETMNVKAVKINESSVRENMRLYNAIG